MLRDDELIIDNFAGGGGASRGLEEGTGRHIDVAINHDPEAVAMHAVNHPHTLHFCQSVWKADPRDVVMAASKRRGVAKALPVGLAWFSPDCKHFSKAKGGKPVEKNIRDLAWVVVHWAKLVRPRIIMLENVEEFRTWGPLIVGDDGKLYPCPVERGATFKKWVRELRKLGYAIEWRELRACDYGAPTIRKRLFIIARCDGMPIVWPTPTHASKESIAAGSKLLPYRTAADCIDWSIPCPSIFTRKKPLAENTLRRIARGVQRYVIEAAHPFIVPITHAGSDRVNAINEPLRTITTAHRGEMALVVPTIVGCGGRAGQSRPRGGGEPFATQTAKADACLVAAFLAQHNAGARNDNLAGRPADAPLSTVTVSGAQQQIVTSHLVKLRGTCRDGQPVDAPMPTMTAGGMHVGEVRAFLVKYFGTALGQPVDEPMHTVTAKARFGLVTIEGVDYQIADIGMRMLVPRELFRAQGFDDSYIIDHDIAGKPITKTSQIGRCGNSVSPKMSCALSRSNCAAPMPEQVAA